MKRIAARVLRELAELGVRVDPSSRIAQQANSYLDPKGILPQIIEPDHCLFQTTLEAMRDLKQIAYILQRLRDAVPQGVLAARLKRLVEDNVLPQDTRGNSFGRDVQCELFVAALCQQARLFAELHESPDVRCRIGRQTLGLAVKRIKSVDHFEERFEQHFRKAVVQIVESRLPGIVVVDISRSGNPANWRVPPNVSSEQLYCGVGSVMDRVEVRFRQHMLHWVKGSTVHGFILLDHHVRQDAIGGWGQDLICRCYNLCPYNRSKRKCFEAFAASFGRSVQRPA